MQQVLGVRRTGTTLFFNLRVYTFLNTGRSTTLSGLSFPHAHGCRIVIRTPAVIRKASTVIAVQEEDDLLEAALELGVD